MRVCWVVRSLLSLPLLSVVAQHGKKVVCGTQAGIVNIYTWGHWRDLDDRALGHPLSVDTILPVDENTLLTGSWDGLIRVMQIQVRAACVVCSCVPCVPCVPCVVCVACVGAVPACVEMLECSLVDLVAAHKAPWCYRRARRVPD